MDWVSSLPPDARLVSFAPDVVPLPNMLLKLYYLPPAAHLFGKKVGPKTFYYGYKCIENLKMKRHHQPKMPRCQLTRLGSAKKLIFFACICRVLIKRFLGNELD